MQIYVVHVDGVIHLTGSSSDADCGYTLDRHRTDLWNLIIPCISEIRKAYACRKNHCILQ